MYIFSVFLVLFSSTFEPHRRGGEWRIRGFAERRFVAPPRGPEAPFYFINISLE